MTMRGMSAGVSRSSARSDARHLERQLVPCARRARPAARPARPPAAARARLEAADRLAADLDDHVGDQQAGARGRAVVGHRADEQAFDRRAVAAGPHRLRGDADVALRHAPVREQLVEHAVDRRHRQHDAVVARERAARDAEHLARRIGHRRAVEPGVEAAVETDQAVDTAAAPGAPLAGHRADMAEARLRQSRRLAADGEDEVADARRRRRRRARPPAGRRCEGHRGEVGAAVDAAHLALRLLAIGQHQRHGRARHSADALATTTPLRHSTPEPAWRRVARPTTEAARRSTASGRWEGEARVFMGRGRCVTGASIVRAASMMRLRRSARRDLPVRAGPLHGSAGVPRRREWRAPSTRIPP